jgi:hypothetical protein
MADLFKDYKSHTATRSKRRFFIVGISLALAVGANMAIFGSDLGKSLQTSVRNYSETSTTTSDTSDIFLDVTAETADLLAVKIGNPIRQASEVRFTLLANDSKIKLSNFFSEAKDRNVIVDSHVPGVYSVIVEFQKPTDIPADSILLFVAYERSAKDGEKTTVNMAESQFRSKDASYHLSNRALEF